MSWLTPLLKLGGEFPHPAVTIIAAFVVAALAALMGQGGARARLNYAAYIGACCVAAVVAGSWAMRFIHG
jgi:hypothetical protein